MRRTHTYAMDDNRDREVAWDHKTFVFVEGIHSEEALQEATFSQFWLDLTRRKMRCIARGVMKVIKKRWEIAGKIMELVWEHKQVHCFRWMSLKNFSCILLYSENSYSWRKRWGLDFRWISCKNDYFWWWGRDKSLLFDVVRWREDILKMLMIEISYRNKN